MKLGLDLSYWGAGPNPETLDLVLEAERLGYDSVWTAEAYVGGMGARGQNFHFDVVARMGFEAEAHKIQDLYLAGEKAEATAAVSTELVEAMAMVGPVAKIRDEKDRWTRSLATTLIVSGDINTIRTAAEIFL
jgi:hypothetical protein